MTANDEQASEPVPVRVNVKRIVIEVWLPDGDGADEVLEEVLGEIEDGIQRTGRTYRFFVDDGPPAILSWPSDLTDDALVAANRLHTVTHMPGGIFDPERNPGGCDKLFCMHILPENLPVVEPAIRADERRRCVEEASRLSKGGHA